MRLTAEVRWFWRGAPSCAFQDWFTGASSQWPAAGDCQQRTDHYLRDADQDTLGIKRRGGDAVEIKGMIGRRASVLELAGCRAPVELWAKWSSKTLNLHDADLVPVEKRRWMRKFRTASGAAEELAGVNDAPERQRGCDAELTLLTDPAGAGWWTFGFEAFGALDAVEGDLAATVALMAGRQPPRLPPLEMAGGYPSWLAAAQH